MAAAGHSDYLKRTMRSILPGFIAVNKNVETLEQPHLQSVSGLAASHRIMALPPGYPEELQNEYKNAPLRFPAKGELGCLGPLSDALLGRRGWGLADVEAEIRIVLGDGNMQRSSFRSGAAVPWPKWYNRSKL